MLQSRIRFRRRLAHQVGKYVSYSRRHKAYYRPTSGNGWSPTNRGNYTGETSNGRCVIRPRCHD